MKKTSKNSKLIDARLNRRWTQQEMADKLGTTPLTINRWEQGKARPNPHFRRVLCQLFEKSEQDLGLVPEEVDTVTSLPAAHALYDPAIPLPAAIPLVGREYDLARIREQFCQGGRSIVLTALNGIPGVGKTSIAIALAHDSTVRAYFCNGILWAGLGPTPDCAGILSRWGTLLGLSETYLAALNLEEKRRAIYTTLGTRSVLVVLDDVWHLEDVRTLRVGGLNCASLLTTRFPKIAAHVDVHGPLLIEELGEKDSMALLRVLAPLVVQREPDKTLQLVRAVGGLPLALTLVGNYLRRQSYNGPERRVLSALELLSNAEERFSLQDPHTQSEAHPGLSSGVAISLESILAVTDQMLTPAARATLYALSVFPPKPDSFSEEAALTVAACTTNDLDELLDAGLLEFQEPGRYRLHQIIADYARLHLPARAGQVAVTHLSNYLQHYLEQHAKAYELLELEIPLILSTLEMVVTQEVFREHVVALVCAAAPFLLMRNYYQAIEHSLDHAYEIACERHDTRGTAMILLFLGDVRQKHGDFVRAGERYEQSKQLADQIDDVSLTGQLLHNLGWVTWKQGNYSQAETYLQEGLALARQVDNREQISNILKVLGGVEASLGRYDASIAYIQEGLALARQTGDRERQAVLLINLGVTTLERAQYAQGEISIREGLALARQIGHREWVSLALLNLSEAGICQRHYGAALEYVEEGLALARQIGHLEWVSGHLVNLAVIEREEGNYGQAETCLQECLELLPKIGRPGFTAEALYEYGRLYLVMQQPEEASAMFDQMMQVIPQEIGNSQLSGSMVWHSLRWRGVRSMRLANSVKQVMRVSPSWATTVRLKSKTGWQR